MRARRCKSCCSISATRRIRRREARRPMGVSDEELQRYFDGELDPNERRRVEGALDDDDRARLEALAEVRAALSGALRAEAERIDIASAVADAIARDAGREAEVISLAGRQPKPRRVMMRLASTGAGPLV